MWIVLEVVEPMDTAVFNAVVKTVSPANARGIEIGVTPLTATSIIVEMLVPTHGDTIRDRYTVSAKGGS